MIDRYSSQRIRKSLIHFIFGKGVSAITGMLAILLVTRILTVPEFAEYSILLSFLGLLDALSGFGLGHSLIRYVPELYSKHFSFSLRNFVYHCVSLRSGLIILAALIAAGFASRLAGHVGLGEAVNAFQVFLLVVVLRSSNNFISMVLESTLHQGVSQMGFSVSALTRFIGMAYLYSLDNSELLDVIWVEALGDAFGLVIIVGGLIRVIRESAGTAADPDLDRPWFSRNLKQIVRFSLSGYAQHLALLPYGPSCNRLVGGNMLTAGSMAAYGFALTFFDYLTRYLPAHLMQGLIRPVMVARYCQNYDFSVAARLADQVLQLNIVILCVFLAPMMVSGPEILEMISAGKYGLEASNILIFLIVLIAMETYRKQLELQAQTVERYHYMLPANAFLSLSIFGSIYFLPTYGAMVFPICNSLGVLIACVWINYKMKANGFHCVNDWWLTVRILLVLAICAFIGLLLKQEGLVWYLAGAFSILLYLGWSLLFFKQIFQEFVREFIGKKAQAQPN